MPLIQRRRAEAPTVSEEGGFSRFQLSRGLSEAGQNNLAESTVQSLRMAELLAMAGDGLDDLALDYGNPAGAPGLRSILGAHCQVPMDAVVTFPGTMLGLYLLASEICAGGDDAVLVAPCFGPMRDAVG